MIFDMTKRKSGGGGQTDFSNLTVVGATLKFNTPKVVLDFSNLTNGSNVFQDNSIAHQFDITISESFVGTFYRWFYDNGLQELTIHGSTKNATGFNMIRNPSSGFSGIRGDEIDYSSDTGSVFVSTYTLPNITYHRVKPSTIKRSMTTATLPNLDNDSLVSIANGLDASNTATLTMSSGQKTTSDTLMGMVTDGVFSIDQSGQTTLTAFITQTKGWTIA